MDAQALWQRYQDWLYYHPGLEFYLDISRVRFDDAFVQKITPQFQRAFADMEALESGAIANPDEGRMVGHYWLRDPGLAPDPAIKQEIIEIIEQIEDFQTKIHSGVIRPQTAPKFTDVISIGIGGSALGPQFVAEALAGEDLPMNIHFIDNSDPDGIDRVLNRLKNGLSRTLVIVISKSGGTPEPKNGMIEVKHAYARQNLDFHRHAVAVTMPGSQLDQQASKEDWLARFPLQDWVGGRTSEMSAVGLLPAALQGIDIKAMLAGAKEMDIATRQADLKNNPAALLAMCWYFIGDGQGKKDMVVLPYKDRLLLFSRYLQQLVMESLGKEKDLQGNIVNQGLAVYGNKGSTDQHAYVQQLREGIPNFFATFIEVLADRQGEYLEVEPGITSGDYLSGFLLGTRQALYENQRDSITVTIFQVDAYRVGALIALYERAVGLYASLININAYHQPGVEAGKKAGAVVLSLQNKLIEILQSAKQPMTLEELASAMDNPAQVETIYKIVRHLSANQRGVLIQGDLGRPNSLQVTYQSP